MLSLDETSVFQTNRFFDKLPMTGFCNNLKVKVVIIGSHSGT
ncbi:hypothetical protein DFO77_107124 [Marinilabilia salmonicolor]|uniref:Uncharacterized protein n=1 Tax=Marinilabilia salmonicolor TaxID=989 RepID=A0A2T0XEI6_9BACT|nr:hypothetical protein BY457_11222 [Marinilabilia salmonicolor]RCW36833.1 hypothetical protein DFO77_107124 [Marinilabilia salmonicolor]